MKKKILILSIVLIALLTLLIGFWPKQPSSQVDKIMNPDKGFNFPPGFPPDPGEAGKKTLEGIDSDHDGLRDDLQRWIYARFPNDAKKRAALKQMAIYFQKKITFQNTHEEMMEIKKRSHKAIECLEETFGRDANNNEMEFVQAKALNTQERIEHSLKVDKAFDGMILGSPYPDDGTACED